MEGEKKTKRPRIGEARGAAMREGFTENTEKSNETSNPESNDNERQQGSYTNEKTYGTERHSYGYNREGGYNNRYNNQGGYNRGYNNNDDTEGNAGSSYGNREGGYNNRYNNQGGYNNNRGGYNNRYNNQGGYNNNRGGYNNRYNNQGGYNNNRGGYNNRYNNQGGYNNNRGYNNNENAEGNNNPAYGNREGGYNNNRNYNNQGGYNNNRGGYNNRYNNQGGYNNNRGGYNNRNNQGGGFGNNRGGFGGKNNRGGMGQKRFVPRPQRVEYELPPIDPTQPIRLNKFLANAGICSRREADEFIQAGEVKVNGNVVTELGSKITPADTVTFRDKEVGLENKVYVLLNKPKDCVTTSDDPQGRLTVMDIVRNACSERIYPVGRLDRNTTGVLLLTNDGDLASKLTHPKFVKKKIYHVWTDKDVTEEDMQRIADGIELDDGNVHADAVSYATETDRNQIGIEIHSGRNRIVRRIFEALGYHVVKLDRVYFAGLTKKNLPRGRWRYLTQAEVNMLMRGSFE